MFIHVGVNRLFDERGVEREGERKKTEHTSGITEEGKYLSLLFLFLPLRNF